MKSLKKIFAIAVVLISAVSCQENGRPNYQFMPNMYEPVGYETYAGSDAFRNGVEAQLPAIGSIARGHMPFEIPNTIEGYDFAKQNLKNPLNPTLIDSKKGKELYDIYCGICHGNKGDGQGTLVKREKILGVPKYDDAARNITEGSAYFTIYYGKNAMGSYNNQLLEDERWQVAAYVMQLKADLEK